MVIFQQINNFQYTIFSRGKPAFLKGQGGCSSQGQEQQRTEAQTPQRGGDTGPGCLAPTCLRSRLLRSRRPSPAPASGRGLPPRVRRARPVRSRTCLSAPEVPELPAARRLLGYGPSELQARGARGGARAPAEGRGAGRGRTRGAGRGYLWLETLGVLGRGRTAWRAALGRLWALPWAPAEVGCAAAHLRYRLSGCCARASGRFHPLLLSALKKRVRSRTSRSHRCRNTAVTSRGEQGLKYPQLEQLDGVWKSNQLEPSRESSGPRIHREGQVAKASVHTATRGCSQGSGEARMQRALPGPLRFFPSG
ncbi:uncharacterized protein LOC132347336 [Balaenoptera ricei]|uniref:uncharacterized protein LOC132347336 n=1 Tax=Balaenoptera ricei TaxID=2746895 RepID=UPI0028BD4B19|nr:uncharacterized protein LOC132347336 [Balaenoptera ricei]